MATGPSDSSWLSPGVLVSVGGLVLSLVGNIVQYRSAKADQELSDKNFQLEYKKWTDEKERMSAELESRKVEEIKRDAVRTELEQERVTVRKTIEQLGNDRLEQERLISGYNLQITV